MTHELFKAAYGNEGEGILDAILKVHDAAPNRDKRAWGLLAKVAEEELVSGNGSNIKLLAGALADAAKARLEAMVSAVHSAEDALTLDQAQEAVRSTDVGSALVDIMDMAERASMEADTLDKRLDASLAQKAEDKRVLEAAKRIQIDKAREGAPVSLITAMDIAKAAI